MQQNNSEILFTRTAKRNGLFSFPTTTFQLTRSSNSAGLGQLTMHAKEAEYTSVISPRDDFRIKKNFWGNRWMFQGDDSAPFGRFHSGFRPSFSFANDDRYYLRVKRNWRLGKKPADGHTLTATFTRNDVPVMVLNNTAKMGFFTSEVSAPLEGSISTNLTDARTIAGLLLFFQSYLDMRNRSSH